MKNEKFLGFRWWCHLENKMNYVDFSNILRQENLPHYASCDYTLMRVAFVEKDGTIIYEGDILNWHEHQGWEIGTTARGYYVVQWDDNEQKFRFYDPHSSEYFDAYDTKFDDVVGNIYENKNLLPHSEEGA